MKKVLIAVIFLLVPLCPLLSPVALQQVNAEFRTVARVVDGDTLVLDNGEKVRLVGVDTPETKDPRKPVQYFGQEATNFTKQMVEGKKVWVEFDQANAHVGHKDKYGRTLAYVFREDGKFLNAEIVSNGFGHAYTQYPFKYANEFKALERQAREQNKGLWNGNAVSTSTPRSPDTTIVANNRSHSAKQVAGSTPAFDSNGTIVGTTPTGKPLYEGPRGGIYHYSASGNKVYQSSGRSSARGTR